MCRQPIDHGIRLSFVGPAMSDAITNLGGGGLSSPWLANLANSLSYTMSFFSTIIGGPIINRIGIKWACVIAALTMPLQGSSYYVNARYHNEAYLLAANVCKTDLGLVSKTANLSRSSKVSEAVFSTWVKRRLCCRIQSQKTEGFIWVCLNRIKADLDTSAEYSQVCGPRCEIRAA